SLGLVPGLADAAHRHAEVFQDRSAYTAWALEGKKVETPSVASFEPDAVELAAGLVSTLAAIGLAALLLWRRRLSGVLAVGAAAVLGPPVELLRSLHSGRIGDYVAWLVAGAAVLGGLFALTLA